MSEPEAFFKKMRDEILATLERRTNIATEKIKFTYTFMGIGSVGSLYRFQFMYLLYLVPVIAILFDLIYFRESYSIQRIGMFLKYNSPCREEQGFEQFVKTNRTSMEDVAQVCLNICTAFCSACMLLVISKNVTFNLFLTVLVWFLIIFYLCFLPYSLYIYRVYELINDNFLEPLCSKCDERKNSIKRLKRLRKWSLSWLWVARDTFDINKYQCPNCDHFKTKHPA